jgi:ABC-type multidrug transport system fused ATPase/permease subunit
MIDILTNFIGTCMFLLPMIVGGYFVYLGLITVRSLVALIQLMNNLAGPLSQSLQMMNRINSIDFITEQINRLTEEEPKQEYPYYLESFQNAIPLEHLGFGYSDEKRVLQDISVCLEKEKICSGRG